MLHVRYDSVQSEMTHARHQKHRTEVSVLLLLLLILLQDSCQIFENPLKIFAGISKLLPVFLLGTENVVGVHLPVPPIRFSSHQSLPMFLLGTETSWGGGGAFAWSSQLGSPVRSPGQSMELPTRFSIRSSTINFFFNLAP